MTLEDLEFRQQYDDFLDMADAFGPQSAASRLRRFRMPEDRLQQIIERYEHDVGLVREHGSPPVVANGNRFNWYTGPRPTDKCWPALKSDLEQRNWEDENLQALHEASSKIVGLLQHPKTDTFKTKGLVVGYVQSGKTTNFTAVMAKAADRGYRLFIVLAGIHNELRRQTQDRLIAQLVDANPTHWHQLTESDRDFHTPPGGAAFFANHNEQAVLCVVKKNKAPLTKLTEWLTGSQVQGLLANIPALIIDDEADQAAIATKTINPLVRGLIDALPRVAYVGYTATPFANVLIDPAGEDLYPEDFIVDLPKPKGHVGTEVLFGREPLDGEDPEDAPVGEDMIRVVPDKEVPLVRPGSRAAVEGFTPDVSGTTVEKALRWFWLATAARRVRDGVANHSTMLVHTSVNTSVHESFRGPVEEVRSRLMAGVADGSLTSELRDQWDEECGKVPATDHGEPPVSFEELWGELPDVLAVTRVILDNSRSEDRLDYRKGPVVAIAVGGNTLSRGLTLEGLVVSYFVRSVSAYDTLLQMGRWFGYREGYSDLPRIWMTTELRDWFRHIATVEADLRQDIARYMVEDETPRTFAARIRTHPSLRVTAAAKMQDAVRAASSYGGQRVQTRYFKTDDRDWLLGNQRAARKLTEGIIAGGTLRELGAGRLLFEGVEVETVLDFLASYAFHERSLDCDRWLLTDYIRRRMEGGVLKTWNVALLGNDPAQGTQSFDFGSRIELPMVVRSRLNDTGPAATDIKTLMSRRDAAVDITDIPTGSLTESAIKKLRASSKPDVGLLTVYPIDRLSRPKDDANRSALDAVEDVVGVGIVFPLPIVGEDATVEWDYVSADLSKLAAADGYLENEDDSIFDEGIT